MADSLPPTPTDDAPSPPKPRAKPLKPQWNFAAAFLGWLLPGLGHFLLGQTQRGVILGTTIGTLWLSGVLVGGISILDRSEPMPWVLGQMLIAPSWAGDAYRQRLVNEHQAQHLTFDPRDDPPFEPAFARADEQGTLFTSLAGLLNLLAIIDVLYRDPRDGRDAPTRPPSASASEGAAA